LSTAAALERIRKTVPAADADRLPMKQRIIDLTHEFDFYAVMGVDEIVDDDVPLTTERPPWLRADQNAYALRVRGETLSPVLMIGDIAYVTTRPDVLRIGDVVVVGRNDGYATMCGLLKRRGPDGVHLHTLTGGDHTVPADKIAFVHRVVGIRRA